MLFNLNKGAFTGQSFQYSGESEFGRAGRDYMIALKTGSGATLRLLKTIAHADLCLVAGGAPGNDGDHGSWGGNGGEVLNITNVSLPVGDYTVTIGGSGQNTVLAAPDGRTWTSRSGYGSPGGDQTGSDGVDGVDGVSPFGDANAPIKAGWLFGPGGGHGFVRDNDYRERASGNGGSVGAASSDTTNGHGATEAHRNGYDGLANTGQGGGGASKIWTGSYYSAGNPGAGGSGILFIRRHKEVT